MALPLYLVLISMLSNEAFAYLDPGNGSMLLQVILGGAAGVGVLVKYYWHQITAVFRPRKSVSPEKEN